MNSVTTKPSTAAAPKQAKDKAQQVDVPSPTQPIAAVASTLLQICEQAQSMFDAMNGTSGVHANSLFELALDEAKRLARGAPSEEHPSDCIYRLAALLLGTLEVDKRERPDAHERHALVEKAYELADAASISFGFSMEPCEMLAVGITAGKQTASEDELSLRQLHMVLEEIAGNSNTLCNLLMLAQTGEKWEASNCVDAGLIVARSIGAMADTATGSGVHGDANHWNYGPNFQGVAK